MKKIYALFLTFLMYSAFGQQGQLDPVFSVTSAFQATTSGLCKDNNGNILAACYLGGASGQTIKRLMPAGGINPDFSMGSLNTNASIFKIFVQNDGKVIVLAVDATSCGSNPITKGIFRTSSSGVFETAFTAFPTGFRATAVAQLSNGDLIVGGIYPSYSTSGQIFRVNSSTGTIVSTFTPGTLTKTSNGVTQNGEISCIKVLPNDEIVIGGDFTSYNGVTKYDLAKINSSGAPLAFPVIANTSPINAVHAMALGTNNSLLVGGSFGINSNGNGYCLIKINLTTSTIDTSFLSPNAVGNIIYDLETQTDGKIVIGGYWTNINGSSYASIARLLNNGTLDPCFNPGTGLGPAINAPLILDLTLDNDNNVYITGVYTEYNGTPQTKYISKISGSTKLIAVSDDITIPIGTTTNKILKVLDNDTINGKLIAAGDVTLTFAPTNTTVTGITVNSNGTITIAPTTAPGTYEYKYSICPLQTNCGQCSSEATATIIVEGPLATIIAKDDNITTYLGDPGSLPHPFENDSYNGMAVTLQNVDLTWTTTPNPQVYLDANGNIVISAAAVAGFTYTINYYITDKLNNTNFAVAHINVTIGSPPITPGIRANNIVLESALQSDGKIIISGAFTAYNNISVPSIIRLKSDLTLDNSFLCTGPSTPGTTDVDVSPDNKIFCTGTFAAFNGVATKGIAMLKSDGSYDTTFNLGGTGLEGYNSMGYSSERLSNGKIVIVGDFKYYNTTQREYIVRVSPSGGLDSTFDGGSVTFAGGKAYFVTIQPNGQPNGLILASGAFTTYQGVSSKGIVRITSSGAIDTAFSTAIGTGFGGITMTDFDTVKLKVQTDNKIIAYGVFTSFNNISKNNIVRLNANGTLDTTFNSGTGFNGAVRSLVLEPDGKMIIGGEFTTYNGTAVKKIVRLTTTGVLDTSFSVGTGPLGTGNIWTLTRQPYDGKVIVGGQFTTYNGISATNITRIAPSVAGSQQRTSETIWESEPEIDTNPIMRSGSVSIYPNPSEGIFNIDFKGYDEQKFDMTIHNTLGQVIYKGVVTPQNTNQIDLTRFDSGSYFITLQTGNETINKIVVKK